MHNVAATAAAAANTPRLRRTVTVIPAAAITTRSGQTGQVRYFAPDGREPVEAVAYMEEKSLVNLLVLSAHDPDGFRRALPAFHDLVYQYRFVAADITTPTHAPAGRRTGPGTGAGNR